VTDEQSLIEQLCNDLNQAHNELLVAQGATYEQAKKLRWPEWTPQANSLRWASRVLGRDMEEVNKT
jgi:hypothetical protein